LGIIFSRYEANLYNMKPLYTKKHFFWLFLFVSVLFSCKKDSELPLENMYTTISLKESRFPDFSYAGYMRSEMPIPLFPVVVTLEPVAGDNFDRIQRAILEVESRPLENGVRGALLLKAGEYRVSQELKITKSGVVIRGEGQGMNGTRIINSLTFPTIPLVRVLQTTAAISISGTGNNFIETGQAKSKIMIDAGVGATSIIVENPAGFAVGDTVVITRTPNDKWIDFIGMRQYGWTADYYAVAHPRIVKDIKENQIEIDVPLVDAIEERFGGGFLTAVRYDGLIRNSGVENMRMYSVYENDEDENHTWSAVILRRTENCWVRNVTAENFSFAAVAMVQANYSTVQDCAMLNFKSKPWGDRRYSFYVNTGSIGNLIQRCYSDGGRHDFSTGAKVTGPNVFLDCYAINTLSDTGPHHRWATGTLYDNVHAGMIYARNAKDSGSGQGWTGAYNMFWNNRANLGFLVENPPGAVNWVIGAQGALYTDFSAYGASKGLPVLPRSIFIEQLKERLDGSSISDIIIPSQTQATPIWNELARWAGNEKPLKGMP